LALGLFTKVLHRWALLAGWLVGMVYGSYEAYGVKSAVTNHFGGATATVPLLGKTAYIGMTALVLNFAVALVGTALLRLAPSTAGRDETTPEDYLVDADDERLTDTPVLV
jgi:SSS family solute:Na+ symporter